jgi:hypothetical protein
MALTIKGRKIYVLVFDNKVIGCWSNLKHLCNDATIEDVDFTSYSKLSKEVAELRKVGEVTELSVTTKEGKAYQIKIEILR